MFLAGLESDLSLLKKYFRPGMFVALLGIIFPVVFGWLTGEAFQVSGNEAIFFGIILAATSVSIKGTKRGEYERRLNYFRCFCCR